MYGTVPAHTVVAFIGFFVTNLINFDQNCKNFVTVFDFDPDVDPTFTLCSGLALQRIRVWILAVKMRQIRISNRFLGRYRSKL